jgi:hypothetical protein
MAEKVIHEIRIVETDDGFRIEIKGDKERLREMFGKGAFPFGMGRHGPFHHGHRGFPWGRWWPEEEYKREEGPTTRA